MPGTGVERSLWFVIVAIVYPRLWADDDAPRNGTADGHDEDDAREREHVEERA